MQTNKSLQVELPGDVFDLDIETVVHPLNVFLDLKMLDRLSQFANALQSNKPVGENLEGLAHLHASTREQELKSSRIRAGVQGGLCIVLYSTGVPRGEQIVLRVSDQVGPRATTHMHSDQSEAVWLVEFDQLSASLDRQSGPAATLYSHLHRASTERTFFEAQMRNTQNEVVIPLEVAIRTDRWKPSFTFVQDITLSDTLPDEAWHQENLGSFWNFFSIFEGRGHQQAMAEATDYSKVIVTLRFPSSHVDLSKSDYDLIVKLLGSGSSDADSDATSPRSRKPEQRPNTINLAEAVSSPNLLDARRRSSLDYPYGELVQKRQNALALNVFFTQGNWVFRENTRREDAEANEGKNNSSPPPHCYELEFVKLHIFQLMQHAGMDANYTVLTGEDFIIHDTISFDNTTPVAERIHRMRKEEVRPMFRGLIQTGRGNTECRFMFDEVVMHHHKGLNWLISLSGFFAPSKSEEEKQRDHERKKALRARRKQHAAQQSNDELAASAFRIGLAFNQLEIEYTSRLLPSQAMATIDLLSVSSEDIVAGSDEDVFRGTLKTLTVYLMDTMRQRSVSSSISDSTDRSGIGGSGLRRRASSITSSGLPPGGSAGYWQQKGYTKVASLDHLDWDIISRSPAYHVEANLPELEINVVSDPSPTCSLTACSDSLQTLLDLVGEWTAPAQKDPNAPEQQKPEPKADLNPLAAALNQVQWDDVAANAFAPKTRPNERKPPRDKHRPGRSNSGGKTSGSQPSSSSTAKKQSSLAAQIKAAEDYDPSASSSGRFVIREDYLSSSSSPDVGRKGKGKEKQESSSHQLQRQHPDARTRPTAKAKAKARAKATKDGEPVRTRRRRRGSDDSGDSSSDIDVDWSSSSTIVDSWDDVVEGEEATQHKAEPKAADPWEQTFADEEEEDYDDEEEEGDEEENDDNEEEGGDVVDGEKIGLERGRKYKLVVEKFPAADAPRQPAETVPTPIMPSNVPPREPQARWLTGDAPQLDGLLIDDFARAPPKSADFGFTLPEGYPLPKLRVFARVDVVVRLVGGADWATPTGSLVASTTSSSGGAAASTDGSDGSWKALPKAGSRNEEVNMQIAVTNLEIQLNELVPGTQHVRRLVVSVGEVEVQDNVPSSDVKTFMCYDRDRPRETGSSMLAVQMECVRPDRAAKPEAEEWRLKVRSLPLRLYIDQDALEFLVQYFSAMEGSPIIPEGEPLYFQSCEVKSVHLKVDYQPKQLDYNALYGDNKVAFFAKAVPLRAAEIHLKPVRVKGRGWDELLGKRLVEAYLPYISRTQLSSVVAGIAPIRSLLNITSGVGDLIYTPMQQWQKDGRILTGLQRGASTALHKWLVEGLNVGTNLTAGAQYVLEAADYYLGGSGGSIAGSSMYAHAPATTEAGMRDAYSSVSRELGAAAHRIVAVPLDQYQTHGATGYLSSLASGVPLAILRPIIGVTEGVTKTLIGVQKWVDPALEDEIATKFKKKPKSQADHHHQYHHRHRQPGVTESRIFASDDDDDYYSRSIDNEEGDTLASQVGGAFYYGASVLGSALPRFGSAAPDSLESSSSYPASPASAFTRRYVSAHCDDNFSDDDSTDDSDV